MTSEILCNTKNKIRKNMLTERDAMTEFEVRESSDEIFEKFYDLNLNFQNVMVYLSFRNEIMTDRFISQFKIDGKGISIPYCLDDKNMIAAKLVDFDEFKINKYGIAEPEAPLKTDKSDIEVCIVPGIAFDENGTRVGFGKGYYDRFLSNTSILKIGICYDFQIVKNQLPSNPNDIKMDYVISEKRIIKL